MSDALVIAGAVLKGPFAAGALAVLSDPAVTERLRLHVRRIVGTSSGALNAAYYAAAIHQGQEAHAGERLSDLWVNDGGIFDSVSLSARALLARRGIATTKRLAALVRRTVQPAPSRRPVSLCLVATNLRGQRVMIGGHSATTHEHAFELNGADFTTSDGVERLVEAVTASAAFPGVFEPVSVRVGGHVVSFVDGGAVNDAPIGYAVEGGLDVDRVFVITPNPRVDRQSVPLRGLAYAGQLADILLDERLVRDLLDAERTNRALERLEHVEPDPERRKRLLAALGWEGRRVVKIVEIRPEGVLPGSAFSGWISKDLRREYVREGRRAAERAILAP